MPRDLPSGDWLLFWPPVAFSGVFDCGLCSLGWCFSGSRSYAEPMKRLSAALGIACFVVAAAPPPTWSPVGMVSSDHQLASEAGATILESGGNAVDAAVATALAAGVVQPAGSGIGGGGFAVFGSQPEDMHCLDFREVAPAAAHPDLFLDTAGEVVPLASTKTGLAVGVPGEARGLAMLLRDHGRLSPKQVARPAIRLAKNGFVTGEQLLKAASMTPMASLFQDGAPGRGQWVRRPRLARTRKSWARSAGEALYVGPIAEDIVEATQAAGGILELSDLAHAMLAALDDLTGNAPERRLERIASQARVKPVVGPRGDRTCRCRPVLA